MTRIYQRYDRTAIAANIIKMAVDGSPRPKQVEGIEGKFLSLLTCEGSNYYDVDIDQTLRTLRPDWFRKPKNQSREMKDELIRMAKAGEPKPSKSRLTGTPSNDRLSTAFYHYLNEARGSYDAEFSRLIHELRPDWFWHPSTPVKNELLALADAGGSPDGLQGRRLRVFTQRSSDSFDPEFSQTIRAKRPDWFYDEATRIKLQLLDLASRRAPKPHRVSHPDLYRSLRRYTRANEKPDPVFIAKLRKIRPDWLPKQKHP
jgi:hypothetical protein